MNIFKTKNTIAITKPLNKVDKNVSLPASKSYINETFFIVIFSEIISKLNNTPNNKTITTSLYSITIRPS